MIEFYLNYTRVCTDAAAYTTLLDYIRRDFGLHGTKIGCREGDCGACTVLIGYISGDKIKYESATSCLTPIANVQGKHVVTIEGLNLNHGLNKVQEAMVKHSATQCGFCTPGFVVSLCAYVLNFNKNNYENTNISAIDGNICRCTGYKSIERAAIDIQNQLMETPESNTKKWLIENNWIPSYFEDIETKVKHINNDYPIIDSGLSIGGGTDFYVQKHDEIHEIQARYVSINRNDSPIYLSGNHCTVSGECTVTQLMESQIFRDLFPGWSSYMTLISSTPIRNIATLAGNIVNASPIGDLSIIFLALDSQVTFTQITGTRRVVPLKELFLGYKVLDKAPYEILTEIAFEIPTSGFKFNFEKVSKRAYLDIASVNTSCFIKHNKNKILSAQISMGGVGPVPMFLKEVSQYLKGKEISIDTVKEATKYIQNEIKPISDVRGSEEYKRLLAKNLFYCHFEHLFPEYIKSELLI